MYKERPKGVPSVELPLRIVRDGLAKQYRLQELRRDWWRNKWVTVEIEGWLSDEADAFARIRFVRDEYIKRRQAIVAETGPEVVWESRSHGKSNRSSS